MEEVERLVAAPRPRAVPRSADEAGLARPARRRPGGGPPPALARRDTAPTYLSAEGLAAAHFELDGLRAITRPQIIARVKAARELGDLRENAEYDAARKEQSFVEGRIQLLEARLRTAVLIDPVAVADTIRMGSTVDVDVEGARQTYVIVGPHEADPARGRISHESPIGRGLIGRRPGDEADVRVPSGTIRYRIVAVR